MRKSFTLKHLLIVLFFSMLFNEGFAQIAAWNNNSLSGVTSGSINATTQDPNLNIPVLSRGSGVTATSLTGGYASSNWVDVDENGAITNNRYYQCTIAANSNYKVSLSTLNSKLRRTSTGPNAYIWRYSINGSNFTDIGTPVSFTTTTSGGDVQPQINLSTISALQNVFSGTTITLRLYAWGASGSAGTLAFGTGNVNSLALGGTVAIASLSANADLSDLTLSAGTLTPVFSSGTTSYTASVANSVSSITVTPTASDVNATIKVNNVTVASGNASAAVALNTGDNIISIVVTAQDGITTKTYSVTVNRASSGVPVLTTISPLADFGNICISTTAGPGSFTINGADLDGTGIFISSLAGFTYAETPGGDYTSTLGFSYAGNSFTGKMIYVKFTPAAVQSYNGDIILNGGGVNNFAVAANGSGINTAPTVTTGSSIAAATTATVSGTINNTGCAAVTAYGIEYSVNSGFPNGTGTQVPSSNLSAGNFSATITGLAPNTRYFYKAYATNSVGTSYGVQQAFTETPLPVVMASQSSLSYTEDFHDIANWSNFFISGDGANHWGGLSATGSGGIPNGTTLTASTNSFQGAAFGSSGGVQKGTDQVPSSTSIVLLSTGTTDNSTSAAIDFYMDFTGVNAGTLSFDWASVNNTTGNRKGSMRVYGSVNGTIFTEITSAAVLNFTNNILTNGSITNIALPPSFNNNPNARLRFYYYNGTGGTTGSRPKISIDNLTVTSVPSTPCSSPTAQPTSMVFGTISDVSIQGSFTAANPSSDQYLTVASTSNGLTSGPVDGVTYNVGESFGDGTVIAKGSNFSFTASGLSPSTTYYFFTFAVNGVCTGGPKYLASDPLTNSATTNAGLPPCTAPSAQATQLVFGNVTISSIQGSFTATVADEYLVVRSTSSTLTADPANGSVYNVGDMLGNGVIVKRSNTTSFVASGLTAGTQYYFFVFSLNSQSCINGPTYNVIEPLSSSQTTQPLPPCTNPLAQPTILTFNAANTLMTGTFNGSGSADNYLIIRGTSSSLSALPEDNIDYNVGESLGGGIVISNSAATSFITNNLSTGTVYYFFVFAANKNCSGGTKYLTASPLTGSATTTNVATLNYYFGNLHAHSDYSDGNDDHPGYTPADDYNYAMTAQCMDFLGISEHNHYSSNDNPGNTIANYHKGSIQADSFTNVHPNFLALYGMEWGVISGGGHVVVYGDGMNQLFGWESGNGGWGPTDNYDVYVPKNVYTGSTGLFKTINDFKDQNTFATLAHPNQTDYNNLAGIAWDAVADSAIVGSAVETGPAFSTNTTYSNPSTMSYLSYYQTLLSKGYHLGPTIDHDNHNTTFGHTTTARTAVIAPQLNKTEIIKAMHDMHFYATEDCDSRVDFRINTKIMGTVFSDRNAPAISVTLSDATTNTSTAIIRIMSGTPGSGIMPVKIDSVIGNSLYFIDNNLATGATGYYYVDITNGNSRIVTSPIWYTRTCSVASDTTVYSCNSYDWNGQTYDQSGTYSKTGLTTTSGCDSTATLHLTITMQTTGDTTAVACNSFNWYGNVYTTSGTPTHILKERGGCDSVVTLHLTIHYSSEPTSFDTSACTSLILPWSETPVTSSGDYSHTYLNRDGCDSVVTAHVTIYQIPSVSITADGPVTFCPGGSVTLSATSAVSYLWSNSATSTSIIVQQSGNYSVTITDANGCSNTSDATTVTVEDVTPPVVHVQNINATLGVNGSVTITPSQINNGSTDNCSIPANGYSLDKTTFNCNEVGENTVTLTVTDANGNSATANAVVTVTDNQDPTITCKSNQARLVNNATCSYKVAGNEFDPVSFGDNCPGATIKNNFNNSNTLANAIFSKGATTVIWTVTDAHGNTANCSMTITVNSTLTISIPDVYAVQPGGAVNTIYIGYGPSSVTLNAVVTGGTAPYSYKWTLGSPAGPGLGTNASFTVSPTVTSTYYLNVKDFYGCTVTYATKTITVTDVRCGSKMDKVTVCVFKNGNYSTNCVTAGSVSGLLASGSYLGPCSNQLLTTAKAPGIGSNTKNILTANSFDVRVSPNPSTTNFKILVQSNSNAPITIRLYDIAGRVISVNNKLRTNETITIGNNLVAGTYFAEIIQGSNNKKVKLIMIH